MSVKNNTSVASQALLDLDAIKSSIKEESKQALKSLLSEAVKDVIREAVNDEEEESDYEVIDDNEANVEDEKEDEVQTSEDDFSEDDNESEDVDEPSVETQEAPEDGEGGEDEWAEFESYKVDDDTYDLTGVQDYEQVVKVYKLMKDDDDILVKQDGDTVKIQDNQAGTEYVIDLGTEDDEVAVDDSEDVMEGCIKESGEDIAGLPSEEDFEDDVDIDAFLDDSDEQGLELEGKKSKKTMKESKEMIFEIDLGYTDNYQDKDPIEGLSMTEPSKSGKSWEKGVPDGTKKPWAGDTKAKGEPFEETIKESEENVVDEATNVGGAVQQRTSSKSHIPANRKEHGPKVKRHVSTAGDYNEVVEAYKKENAALKESLKELKNTLIEARVTNANLAKITRLFVENTVSQTEKIDIVNRFSNEAKTLEQSKALYESIDKSLKNRKQLTVESTSPSTVENKKVVNEVKETRPKDLLETLDLIRRIEKY